MTDLAKPIFIDIDDNLKHTRVGLLVDLDEFLSDVSRIRGSWGILPDNLLGYGDEMDVRLLVERVIWKHRFPKADFDAEENLTDEEDREVRNELEAKTKDSERLELLFSQNNYKAAMALLVAIDDGERYNFPLRDIDFTLDDLVLKYGCPAGFRGLILKAIACGRVKEADYQTVDGYTEKLVVGELWQEMIRRQRQQITLAIHPWTTQDDVADYLGKYRAKLIRDYESENGNEILPDADTKTAIKLTRCWYWTRRLNQNKYIELAKATYVEDGGNREGELLKVANLSKIPVREFEETDLAVAENRIKQRVIDYSTILSNIGKRVKRNRNRWDLSWRQARAG